MALTAKLTVAAATKKYIDDLIATTGKGLPTRVKNNAAMQAAAPIKAAISSLAPSDTGKLRRSIVAKKSKPKARTHAFVAFDIKKMGRKNGKKRSINIPIWMNYGTKAHGPKYAKNLVFKGSNGSWRSTKRVRGVKANPFMDRGIRSQVARSGRIMERVVRKYLKRKYKFDP